ncbi:MAG: N-acetylmuramoyl-L-alanine amidase, partial [Planctomycetota bacterium]|nr:N-acetylmuramoyl-L-alanine amidase [Planctomycetota bacterium]
EVEPSVEVEPEVEPEPEVEDEPVAIAEKPSVEVEVEVEPSDIGVVALGNFDRQQPSRAQLNALRRHVRLLMSTFNVPATRLRTHQEWAPTACPGRSLQRYMVAKRDHGAFG